MSAVSNKSQGAAGVFGINLPLTGTAGIEDRIGGPTQLVLTFANPIVEGPGFNVSLTSGTVSSTTVNGSQLTINLSGATDGHTLTVNISDVADSANGDSGNYSLNVGVLTGDVTQDGSVIVSTTNIHGDVRRLNGTTSNGTQSIPVDTTNFQQDVNDDGFIDANDIALVNGETITALAAAGANSFATGPMVYGVLGQGLNSVAVAEFTDA